MMRKTFRLVLVVGISLAIMTSCVKRKTTSQTKWIGESGGSKLGLVEIKPHVSSDEMSYYEFRLCQAGQDSALADPVTDRKHCYNPFVAWDEAGYRIPATFTTVPADQATKFAYWTDVQHRVALVIRDSATNDGSFSMMHLAKPNAITQAALYGQANAPSLKKGLLTPVDIRKLDEFFYQTGDQSKDIPPIVPIGLDMNNPMSFSHKFGNIISRINDYMSQPSLKCPYAHMVWEDTRRKDKEFQENWKYVIDVSNYNNPVLVKNVTEFAKTAANNMWLEYGDPVIAKKIYDEELRRRQKAYEARFIQLVKDLEKNVPHVKQWVEGVHDQKFGELMTKMDWIPPEAIVWSQKEDLFNRLLAVIKKIVDATPPEVTISEEGFTQLVNSVEPLKPKDPVNPVSPIKQQITHKKPNLITCEEAWKKMYDEPCYDSTFDIVIEPVGVVTDASEYQQ